MIELYDLVVPWQMYLPGDIFLASICAFEYNETRAEGNCMIEEKLIFGLMFQPDVNADSVKDPEI